jgi:hypothetical protein
MEDIVADQTLTQKIEDGVDGVDTEEVQNRIRLAAYGIWEEEGKPDGRADDHWQEAERRTRTGRDYMRRDDSGVAAYEAARVDPASAPKGATDGRPTTGADSTARPSARTTRGAQAQGADKGSDEG